ncbi:MAG: twin-arginine translocase subunit TatC [Opitutia bacterium Tous-C2FEB]|nr:MAG: twin-arginine translocase subunit TatC [Opitutae bacterium Tous-C2FEB]
MLSTLIRRNRPRSEMSFMEHIDDLRVSMIRVLAVFMVGMVASLIFYEKIPAFLNLPLEWAKNPETSPIGFLIGKAEPSLATLGELKEFTFMGVWSVLMYAAFAAGIALASPVFLYEVVRFVGPALNNKEKRGLIPFCVAALILFFCGATLAFLWLTPMSVQIWHHFASGMGIEVTWQASDYYSFVTMMSLLTGLTFQFPLALIILMWLELVRPRTLLKSWRGMLFGILVLVGLITPIGDPLSLFVLTGILFCFYLVAVGVGGAIVRRKRIARGDKPNPEDDDIGDDDDDEPDPDGSDDASSYDSPSSSSYSSSAAGTVNSESKAVPAKPKSTPPPAEGDLSSLD